MDHKLFHIEVYNVFYYNRKINEITGQKKSYYMGQFKLVCKTNLRQLQTWGFRTLPSDSVFKVLLSPRLTQLENQISHYENIALHKDRPR